MEYVERFQLLLELAESCKARLYFLKSQLEGYSIPGHKDERPDCLINPDLAKIRQKFVKSFPNVPDVTKIPGYEIVTSQAQEIGVKLSPFRSLVDDVVTFTESSRELLTAIASAILDFKLERNRNISLLFFDLLVNHVKVLWIFSTIDDKKVLFCFSEIAYELLKSSNNQFSPSKDLKHPSQKVTKVIADLDNIHIYFIQSFFNQATLLKPLLLQFKEPIDYAEKFSELRDKNVFTSTAETAQTFSRYSSGMISATSSLNRYTELKDVYKYREYVIYSSFVCPTILGDVEILKLFEIVATGSIFLGLYRDMTFNIHTEFEVLSLVFPPQDSSFLGNAAAAVSPFSSNRTASLTMMSSIPPSVVNAPYWPPGFKFKRVLKDIARETIRSAAFRYRERRSFIFGELTSMNYLFDTLPGLVAPKFPAILAATAFAKEEIVNYFRIVSLLSSKTVRKDCRKYLELKDFETDEIALLLSELRKMIDHVRANQDLIFNYHMEYLTQIDLRQYKPISTKCVDVIEGIKPYFDGIMNDLESLSKFFQSSTTSSNTSKTNNPQESIAMMNSPSLKQLRYNWNQLLCMLYSQNVSIVSRNLSLFQELSLRMNGVYERSLVVDSFDQLIGEFMEPYDIWWFRSKVIDSFHDSINTSNRQSLKSSSFLTFLPGIRYTLHPLNTIETDRIKLSVDCYMDDRMEELAQSVINLLKLFYAQLQALEKQVTQVDAARRIEKIINHKLTSKTNNDQDNGPNGGSDGGVDQTTGQEEYPGTESETWAKQSIEKLIDLRQRLVNTMIMAKELKTFRVFNREYNMSVFLRLRIISFVEETLINLFAQSATESPAVSSLMLIYGTQASIYNLQGPKMMFTRLKSLCHATQVALGCIDCHISSSMRSILFKECCDTSIPPPGVPPSISSVFEQSKPSTTLKEMIPKTETEYYGNVLWKIVDWFTKLCHQVISLDNFTSHDYQNKLFWAPYLNAMIRGVIPSNPSNRGRNGSVVGSIFGGSTSSLFSSGISLESIALETFLTRQELSSLCHMIGIQGVRILDQELLNLIIEKITIIKDILFKNQQDLVDIYDNVGKVFDIYRKIQEKISGAFTALREMGLLFAIQEILHMAMKDALETYSSSLVSLTKHAADMIHPQGYRQLSAPYHYLSFDCGNIESANYALAQSLAPYLYRSSDRPHISLLPILGSLMFLDETWKHSVYIPHYDCFVNNEHIVTYALSKLFICSYAKETIPELDASLIVSSSQRMKLPMSSISPQMSRVASLASSRSDQGSGYMISPSSLSNIPDKRPNPLDRKKIAELDLKIHCEAYLILSSQILYLMRDHSHYNKHYPILQMMTVLEHYISYVPGLEYSELNRLIPNCLLHAGRMNAVGGGALGTGNDGGKRVGRSNSLMSSATVN